MHKMNKSFLRAFLTALMVIALVLVVTVNFGVVQASTEVTGISVQMLLGLVQTVHMLLRVRWVYLVE